MGVVEDKLGEGISLPAGVGDLVNVEATPFADGEVVAKGVGRAEGGVNLRAGETGVRGLRGEEGLLLLGERRLDAQRHLLVVLAEGLVVNDDTACGLQASSKLLFF